MKIGKNKIAAITIAVFFMLSMTASVMLIPSANAHSPPWQIPTFAFTAATPNPISVDQTATISMWITNVYPSEFITNNYRFHNFELTITAPGGTVVAKETFATATPDSFVTYYYTPTKAGAYIINFTYPGEVYGPTSGYAYDPTSPNVNDTFLPSHATATLTVQQQPITPPLTYPLPTAYWTHPISGQNTAWSAVASNYIYPNVPAFEFGVVRYVPGVAAPSSGHIMWTDPIQFGGYTGANSPNNITTYYDGRSYDDRFSNPIIISGNLYFALPVSNNGGISMFGPSPINGGYVDINLQTGQQVWKQYFTVDPSFGVIFNTVNPNQFGAEAYLIAVSGTTWIAYDPYTGDWLFNITNVPSGWSGIYGPNGEPLIYTLNVAPTGNWLALWNFTDAVANGNANYLAATGWYPIGQVFNSAQRLSYSWNVTIPTLPSGAGLDWAVEGDVLLGSNLPVSFFGISDQFGGISESQGQNPQAATFFALSLQPSTLGQLLWKQTYTTPDNLTFQLGQVDPTNNVFIMSTKETMQWYGYSLTTGKQLWGPVGNATAFNYYSTIGQGVSADVGYIAYGNFYVGGYGGIVYCYSDTSGNLEWSYGNGPVGSDNSTNSGFNTPYGNYPTFVGLIADGMVYVYNGNHGNGNPLYLGYTITCLNAATGAKIWSEQSGVEVGAFEDNQIPVADGDIAYFNAYDGQVYCLGKGPSATTIETPLEGVPQGGRLVIQGTVMDTSAGAKQTEQAADFPNGVPCVSDASESAWMEYVYMQYPMPTNATGVPVTISAIDPNGNYVVLGHATTDSSGLYSLEINSNNLLAGPGTYTVTATFAGSNSYWGSSAESTLVISPPAPTASPYPSPVTGLASFSSLEIGIAAVVIIMVICVAVLAVLIMRKRP